MRAREDACEIQNPDAFEWSLTIGLGRMVRVHVPMTVSN
jgi:hypothetical protein